MKYSRKSFTVPLGGKEFSEGWDRIFGQKDGPCPSPLNKGKHCWEIDTNSMHPCCGCDKPRPPPEGR